MTNTIEIKAKASFPVRLTTSGVGARARPEPRLEDEREGYTLSISCRPQPASMREECMVSPVEKLPQIDAGVVPGGQMSPLRTGRLNTTG